MTGAIQNQEKFYAYWEKRRAKKWWYILKSGTTHAIITSVFTLLFVNRFNLANASFLRFVVSLFVFEIGGLAMAWLQFNVTEKRYLKLKDAEVQQATVLE